MTEKETKVNLRQARKGKERSEEGKRSKSPREVWGKIPRWTPQRLYPFVVC